MPALTPFPAILRQLETPHHLRDAANQVGCVCYPSLKADPELQIFLGHLVLTDSGPSSSEMKECDFNSLVGYYASRGTLGDNVNLVLQEIVLWFSLFYITLR